MSRQTPACYGSSISFIIHLDENNCTMDATPPNQMCYESSTEPNGFYFDCIDDCTTYSAQTCSQVGQVCSSDFGTYPNKCEMSKYACETYGKDDLSSLAVSNNGKCNGMW